MRIVRGQWTVMVRAEGVVVDLPAGCPPELPNYRDLDFDPRAVERPGVADALRAALATPPVVPWDVDLDRHYTIIHEWLRAVYKNTLTFSNAPTPRKSSMTATTWGLVCARRPLLRARARLWEAARAARKRSWLAQWGRAWLARSSEAPPCRRQ